MRYFNFFVLVPSFIFSVVQQKPCAIGYTPNSILLSTLSSDLLRYAEDRPRYSTCTGVCWCNGEKNIFALNLLTSSVQVYTFDKEKNELNSVRFFDNSHGMDLFRPDNFAISKDEQMLAIVNMGSGKVNLYYTDKNDFINPIPAVSIQDYKVHGAQFTPDCKYLAYVALGPNSKICIYEILKSGDTIELILTQKIDNPYEPLRPKSIIFSHDGRYAAVGYCIQLNSKAGLGKALIASYSFDINTGTINPDPITVVDGLFSTETIAFSENSSCIFAVDQIKDRITAHQFDLTSGKIGSGWVALSNPEAQLNFPHGMAVSPSGKYIAVSNYGDDKVTVYRTDDL